MAEQDLPLLSTNDSSIDLEEIPSKPVVEKKSDERYFALDIFKGK
jgi:hypothetical protein